MKRIGEGEGSGGDAEIGAGAGLGARATSVGWFWGARWGEGVGGLGEWGLLEGCDLYGYAVEGEEGDFVVGWGRGEPFRVSIGFEY